MSCNFQNKFPEEQMQNYIKDTDIKKKNKDGILVLLLRLHLGVEPSHCPVAKQLIDLLPCRLYSELQEKETEVA